MVEGEEAVCLAVENGDILWITSALMIPVISPMVSLILSMVT